MGIGGGGGGGGTFDEWLKINFKYNIASAVGWQLAYI